MLYHHLVVQKGNKWFKKTNYNNKILTRFHQLLCIKIVMIKNLPSQINKRKIILHKFYKSLNKLYIHNFYIREIVIINICFPKRFELDLIFENRLCSSNRLWLNCIHYLARIYAFKFITNIHHIDLNIYVICLLNCNQCNQEKNNIY